MDFGYDLIWTEMTSDGQVETYRQLSPPATDFTGFYQA
jgi:hypothetical protein